MTQSWSSPFLGTSYAILVLKTDLPNTLNTLRDNFAGTSAPTSPVAYQLWADTTTGTLKQYSGAAWTVLGPLNGHFGRWTEGGRFSSLSATTSLGFFCARSAGYINGVALVSMTATVSSAASSKEWVWMLRNVTQTQDLFSGTVGTGTALGGVGGGELAVETEYELLADQNNAVAKGDVLRFSATKVGSPTTIDDLVFHLDGYATGA